MKVAELFTTISVDTTQFNRGVNGIRGKLQKLDDRAQKTMQSIGKLAKIGFVGLSAAIGFSVKKGADLSRQ